MSRAAEVRKIQRKVSSRTRLSKKLGTERLRDLNLNARGARAQAAVLIVQGNFNYVLNGSTRDSSFLQDKTSRERIRRPPIQLALTEFYE